MQRRLAIAMVGLVGVVLLGPSLAGAAPDPGGVHAARATPTPANETVRHEKPERVRGGGSIQDVQAWLAGRLSERLNRSAIELSQGQYESARELLGNRTRRLLGRFVDVADETETDVDDRATDDAREAIERQREFAAEARNYSRTYEAYREARRNGSQRRARRLARDLERTAEELNRTGRRLIGNYRNVSAITGVDTSNAVESIAAIIKNVTARQENVTEAVFVETTLRARARSPNATPLDPLVVRGRLRDANGSAISGGTVAIREGRRLASTRTNATGWFRLSYRPVLLSRDVEEVTVRYFPEASSRYLGANATVNVTITPVESSVRIVTAPDVVRFDDEVDVTAHVIAGERVLDGVPVTVTLGGVRLGTARTDGGSARVSARVPATLDDGRRRLRVELPFEGRAITSANETRFVRIEESPTRLRFGVETRRDRRIRITGRLTTRAGVPIPDREVEVRIGGERVGGDLTNATGAIDATLTVPEGVGVLRGGNLTTRVRLVFDAPATNLEGANASTRVFLAPGSGGAIGFGVPEWAWFGLGALVLVVAVATYRALSDRGETDEQADEPGHAVEEEEPGDASPDPLRALARDRLETGETDGAIEAGYEAARRSLAATVETSAGTHWEFYRAAEDAGFSGERLDALRELTESYERAAFAAGSASIEAARDALALVEVVTGEDQGRAGAPADD